MNLVTETCVSHPGFAVAKMLRILEKVIALSANYVILLGRFRSENSLDGFEEEIFRIFLQQVKLNIT